MSTVIRTISFSILRRTFLKHISYLALVGVLAVLAVPDTGFARVFSVIGLENFVRSNKGPATEVLEFSVQSPGDSEFNLHVFYGGLKR